MWLFKLQIPPALLDPGAHVSQKRSHESVLPNHWSKKPSVHTQHAQENKMQIKSV